MRLIIWGFASDHAGFDGSKAIDSFAFIFAGFRRGFAALGFETLWLDDNPASAATVQPGDTLLCLDIVSQHAPIIPGVRYITHNCNDPKWSAVPAPDRLAIQYHFTDCPGRRLNPWTTYDAPSRTLYQPWATDLMPDDAWPDPVAPQTGDVNWVGSVWDNEQHQGNEREYAEMKAALARHGIKTNHRFADGAEHRRLIRESRIAPAIQSAWQVEKGYIPCRAFKNASYGQVVITNSPAVNSIFQSCVWGRTGILNLITVSLGLSVSMRLEIAAHDQRVVREHHTYRHRCEQIIKSLEGR